MKRKFKIIGLIFLVLLVGAIAYILYLTDFGKKSILFDGPRRPKIEIPFTYTIGWWSNQNALSIDSLNIEIIDSRLNLFNSKSLISYYVSGHLAIKGFWQPKIKEVHISERINTDTTINYDRIIEITPVVYAEKIDELKAVSEKFEFRNEHIIHSNHWGINRIRFICVQKEKTIELYQRK